MKAVIKPASRMGSHYILRLSLLFKRNCSGVAAVEFAIVGIPFLALLFSIMQVALVFFGNMVLENAASQAARLIRTGQVQEQGLSQEAFKNEVCSRISALFSCSDNLKIDVKTFDNFGDITFDDPLDTDGNLREDFGYDVGDEEQIVLVRVFYEWSIIADFPANFPFVRLSNMANGNRLLSAAATFRNEPFGN